MELASPTTPFAAVAATATVRRASKEELMLRVQALEEDALLSPPPSVVGACLEDARFFTPRLRRVYGELAGRGARVRAFACGLTAAPAPGVEGVWLDDDDPLAGEWTLLLSGPRPFCFAARDLREPALSDAYRSFEWTQTDDPALVEGVANLLGLRTPTPS